MSKIRPDLKRYDELIDKLAEKEKGKLFGILPIVHGSVLSVGYEEHPDADMAILHYLMIGDKSSRAVSCKISDGSEV